MGNILTIRETVARAKAEGLPVSEYTLRTWVKCGYIPVVRAGLKQLIYYPNLVRYLKCEGWTGNTAVSAALGGNPLRIDNPTKAN